ncbi:hypothetical protein [Nitrospirillum sp. BR 11163]|uniref:hypothetical protein n=1 Tax=Nitrospirillum sp. BR 11163 TaxID=3104323 RepID=UPI002AFE3779|nr:hypothetical protein [Nitrospirillum sp. BR 11163]MEA1676863.1 hypothetical protein [Nitrospirillum sp. BR 11163]
MSADDEKVTTPSQTRLDREAIAAVVMRVQQLAKQYGTPDRSLADELIAERRVDAEQG